MADTQLTWLGHASFRFDSPGGKRVYVDPFLNGNPKTPDNEKEPERVDIIAITHGHGDHVGDTVDIWKKHKPVVIAPVELHDLLVSKHGIDEESARDPNKGGTVEVEGIKFSLTDANHSSSIWLGEQLVYSGEPVGLRDRGRERDEDLLRRGHERLRRHAAHQAAVRARRRRAADRRPLHHGSARGGGCARVPRREALRPLPLGDVPSADGNARRSCASSPTSRSSTWQPGDTITV